LLVYLWGPARTATLAVLLVVLFLGGWYETWQYVRHRELASGRFAVTPERIATTPQPAWIHGDVRGDVLSTLSPDRPLSLLDDNLAEHVVSRFRLHPWVAGASARCSPGRVDVEIVYRKPACMVEMPQGEMIAVDAQGVQLPQGNFSPIEQQSYPCLAGIDTRPMEPVGQRWGDVRVVDGAEIAAALGSVWQKLKLFRIQACAAPDGLREPAYELFTRTGTRIFWGLAPGTKTQGDLPVAEKVARLVRYAAEHGSLDGRDGPQQLDLRALPPVPANAGSPPGTP
jgi:hypothetical protein